MTYGGIDFFQICIWSFISVFVFNVSVYLWHMAVLTGAMQRAWNQWEGGEAGSQQLSFFSIAIIIIVNIISFIDIIIFDILRSFIYKGLRPRDIGLNAVEAKLRRTHFLKALWLAWLTHYYEDGKIIDKSKTLPMTMLKQWHQNENSRWQC